MKRNYGIILAAIAIVTGTALAALNANEQSEAKAIYTMHCAMCHGQDGKGETPIGKKFQIPDLHSAAVQTKSDAELTEIIENGKQKMPAFKSSLKPEQVKDLVEFVKAMGKTAPPSTKK